MEGHQHLHIPVDDVEDENLITWFPRSNRFIDEALSHPTAGQAEVGEPKQDEQPGSGVLVHW
jgi:hypothetical protein